MNVLPIQRPHDDRRMWCGLVALVLTALAVLALYCTLLPAYPPREITQQQMFVLIKAGHVTRIVNEPDPSTGIRYLIGNCNVPSGSDGEIPARFKVALDLALSPNLAGEIQQAGYTGTIETINNNAVFVPRFFNLVPVALFLLLGALLVLSISRFVGRPLKG